MAFRRNKDDGPGPAHYRMREKMFAIGDDYWIEDNDGQKVFKVNGKALRIRYTLVIEDLAGNELYKIQEKKLSVRDAMEIERGGDTIAKVKKAMIRIKLDKLDSAAAKKFLTAEVAPALFKASKCPDLVEDRGHYFGSELPDADKRALIEFLKTL